MSESDRTTQHWQRSTYCADGACVEVAASDEGVVLRNGGDPASTVRFTAAEWAAFLAGVKQGEFDR